MKATLSGAARRKAVIAFAILTAGGCASASRSTVRTHRPVSRHDAFFPVAYGLKWVLRSAGAAPDSGKLNVGSDRSVGMGGILEQTVNEVVPIPGTDMVRVGVLQEGSLFQSNFRSPQQETMGQSGSVLTNAAIVFRVFRPVR